jgi:hypothetical protein
MKRWLLAGLVIALLGTMTPASAGIWHPRVSGHVSCQRASNPPSFRVSWSVRNGIGIHVPMRILSHSRPLTETFAGTTITSLTQIVKALWRWTSVTPDGTTVRHRKTGTGKGYAVLLGDCLPAAAATATFNVLGNGTADVTWGNIAGSSQATVGLPWTATVTLDPSFDVAVLLAQDDTGSASAQLTCQIVEGGVVVAQTTASGAYAVCDASH